MPSSFHLLDPWQGYYTQIEEATQRFWQQVSYLDHGRVQTSAVWQQLQKKVQELLPLFFAQAPLKPFEIFLLSAATLLYENGWQVTGAREATVTRRYELSGELIRRSYRREEGAHNLGLSSLDPTAVETLASLCAAIGQENLSSLSLDPVHGGYQETVRPRYLVALLQLADYLLVPRQKGWYFHRLTHFREDDEARLALHPYALFTLARGSLTTSTRINPVDIDYANRITDRIQEPINRWWAANWRWLAGELQVELTLYQIKPKTDDKLSLDPLSKTCKALPPYLDAYHPPVLELPTPEQVREVRAETTRRLALVASAPGQEETYAILEPAENYAYDYLRKNAIEQEILAEKGVDVGIVIALDEEFAELLSEIKHRYQSIPDGETGREYYLFEQSGMHNSYLYRCVATFVGEMGPMLSSLVTHRLTERWKPRTLVMLGIAAAMSKDTYIGDVVVAKQIDSYFDNSKAVPDQDLSKFTFSFGGEVYRSNHALLNATKNFKFVQEKIFQEWQSRCQSELSQLISQEQYEQLIAQKWLRAQVQTVSGDLASGPTVGAAQAFVDWLKKRNRKYAALEMEAAGFMAAMYEETGMHLTLVLRAISDYGDERKQELDAVEEGAFRRYAMRNAIQLLWRYLEAGILPRASLSGR